MRVVAVDDERLALNRLTKLLRLALPAAELVAFTQAAEAFDFMNRNVVDIAFLDVEMGNISGVALAKRCKELCPKVNIIFVTAYSEYMMEAFRLHVSGYLLKPVLLEDLRAEIANLRHPDEERHIRRVRIQTFGYFEIFIDERPLALPRAKCKECLAFLVDRKGARVTNRELAAILWEEERYDRAVQNNTLKIISDLMRSIRGAGVEDLIIKSRGDLALNVAMVDCDYYQALNGDLRQINAFNGEYMSNYSWAEFTLGGLFH